jgi:hypothetical protein
VIQCHVDALAKTRDSVKPAEELEILSRRQLGVEEEIMAENTDSRPQEVAPFVAVCVP